MGTLSNETLLKLKRLESLLSSLPASIRFGEDHYNFVGFTPSRDDVELYGTRVAALNRTLEVTFCPGGRVPGRPIALKEQGNGLVSIVLTLEKYLTYYPEESALLLKWVDDLTEAAQAAGACEQENQICSEIVSMYTIAVVDTYRFRIC